MAHPTYDVLVDGAGCGGLTARVRPPSGFVPLTVSVSRTTVYADREVVPLGTPRHGVGPGTLTPVLMPQNHLEPVLADHLRAFGGEVRFGMPGERAPHRPAEVAVAAR